jgi:hypothetical protein
MPYGETCLSVSKTLVGGEFVILDWSVVTVTPALLVKAERQSGRRVRRKSRPPVESIAMQRTAARG